jgi:hypothetical protein
MFNSSVIDVAIGLVFVFLLLSLVASAAKEGLESFFKRRAEDLEKGIKELVGKDGGAFVASLYNHGLINSLFAGTYGDKKASLPSYIPAKNFALALMDLWNQGANATPPVPLPSNVKQALEAFTIPAGTDLTKMQALIEDWFNSSMDRVSGWYKRRTQYWLFGIGLVITIAVNVDCGLIAKRLSTDTTLRQAVVTAAQAQLKKKPASTTDATPKSSDPLADPAITQIKTNLSALDGVGLPLGWSESVKVWHADVAAAKDPKNEASSGHLWRVAYWNLIFSHIVGWLLTALAVSLGAPFWFDTLNKIMVVRSTVKPHEKSKEEGSKDPGTPKTAPEKS